MKRLLGLTLLAAAISLPVMADCTYPKAPGKVPDGNTAALEDMQAGIKAVKEYDTAIKAYQACLQLEQTDVEAKLAKDSGGQLSEEQKKKNNDIYVQRVSSADEELAGVAARLNEQIRIYKAKHPPK